MSPRSLQGRVLGLVLSAMLTIWCVTAVWTWLDARHELDELLDGHLAQAAALLVVQQVEADDDHERPDAPSLHRYAPRVAFQVFHEGRLVARSAQAPVEPMAAQLASGFADVRMHGRDWRVFATHSAERDVQVYVGEQRSSRAAILRALLRSTLWPMALALPLIALATWWAVRRGLVSLRRLGQTIEARAPQALQPIETDARTPDELRPVVEALNALFARIATLLESERRFTADAAHELRTPIAAIRAQAQVAQAEADAALRDSALHATLEGCDRAARLVDQLLLLARVEAGDIVARSDVDLAAVARAVIADAAPAVLARRQHLSLEAGQGCPVRGDAMLLSALLRNLVDNALRYAGEGATVEVAVARDAHGARLSVHDSGPGLSEADIARLGQRFFRVVGQEASGSGLGWSIVRRIAEAFGARVSVQRSARLGGLAVEIGWP